MTPALTAFRERFVRNPDLTTFTQFGFFEAGWKARDAEVERLRIDAELGALVRGLPRGWTLFHHPDGWMVERVMFADGSNYREALAADEDPCSAIGQALVDNPS